MIVTDRIGSRNCSLDLCPKKSPRVITCEITDIAIWSIRIDPWKALLRLRNGNGLLGCFIYFLHFRPCEMMCTCIWIQERGRNSAAINGPRARMWKWKLMVKWSNDELRLLVLNSKYWQNRSIEVSPEETSPLYDTNIKAQFSHLLYTKVKLSQ
jgi:hypothetical protein